MSWLLSLVGIVLISVLVDILLPSGQTNKFIKGIFSILVVFVLITPLIKLKNGNFDIGNLFSNEEVAVDSAFINKANERELEYIENNIIEILAKKDIKVEKVVLITKSGNINSIDNVQVKAAKIEQSSSIKSIVSEILSIDEKYIIVYE